MEKEKKINEATKYIMENYDIKSAGDIAEALKDLMKDTLQEMMNAEFEDSIGYPKSDNKIEKENYRNGHSTKKVKSSMGEFELEIPRDRNASFEPLIVPKNQRNVAGIEERIIALYGRGLSTREISEEIEGIYGIEVSSTMVSNITDTILPKIKEWQNRPLQEVYPIMFIDAIHFNVKEENRIVKKAAYIVLGVSLEGSKEVLGIWVGENESSKFWLGVMNDMKNRGVKDILVLCSDGLCGIKEAINASYPGAVHQRCIVHLIRNSVKFVSYKDLKEFCSDLKTIYGSVTEEEARDNLGLVKEKWKSIYPTALKVWEDAWESICHLFNYSKDLRKILYTTNAIESLNRGYRKYTKTKGVFPTNDSLLKSLYLATMNITKKWNGRYRNWDLILNEIAILFPDRF